MVGQNTLFPNSPLGQQGEGISMVKAIVVDDGV